MRSIEAMLGLTRNADFSVYAPQKQAAYPLTFSPLRRSEEELLSKLVLSDLRDKNKPIKFEFDLRGTAEESLAEGHRIVRCSARERVEQSFTLRNSCAKGESSRSVFAGATRRDAMMPSEIATRSSVARVQQSVPYICVQQS